MRDFKCASGVVPDADGLVLRAGYDQLFADADVEAGNWLGVEVADNIVKFLVFFSPIQGNGALQELIALGYEVHHVFSRS